MNTLTSDNEALLLSVLAGERRRSDIKIANAEQAKLFDERLVEFTRIQDQLDAQATIERQILEVAEKLPTAPATQQVRQIVERCQLHSFHSHDAVPMRRMAVLMAAAAAVVGAFWIQRARTPTTPDVMLGSTGIQKLEFDRKALQFSWEPVTHAEEYHVVVTTLNGSPLAQPTVTVARWLPSAEDVRQWPEQFRWHVIARDSDRRSIAQSVLQYSSR